MASQARQPQPVMLSAAALEQRKKLQKRDNNFHTPGDNVIRHHDRTLLMGAAKG